MSAQSQCLLSLVFFLSLLARGTQFHRRNEAYSMDKNCSLTGFMFKARCYRNVDRLFCKGGITEEWSKHNQFEIRSMTLLEWPGKCLNMGRLQQYFPALTQLELINSSALVTFKGHLSSASRIEKLVMHGMSSLWELPPDVISPMSQLRELDLRNNALRYMKSELLQNSQLDRVYLDHNEWDCSDGGLDWLAMEKDNGTVKRKIVDYYEIMCHHQLYRGKPLHKVMDIIRNVRLTCPEPCACAMTHVVSDPTGGVIPLITVDCSNKDLDSPPAELPPSTTTLRLEGNKINAIRMIVQNPQYKKLADLYLDNNSIPTVKELEATEWFNTFRVLSLRGNMLKQIPVYAFDKAFQSNNNIMHVYLGQNPWRCDCHFIPRFQGLLLKYRRVIRDLSDIRCSKSDDKTISFVQISTLPLANVCRNEVEMPISVINIINLVLAFLIILILGKFLYDWHNFKTTGKLPWISSIMP